MKKIAVLLITAVLLVGCTGSTDKTFKEELETMYIISIDQVLNFMELEEEDIEKDEIVERIVKSSEEYINTIEEFQEIDVPQDGENLYEKINLLAMDLSNTLVMLAHSIEQDDTGIYQSQKDNLAFLFIEAGYIGEELGDYLGEENFIEDIMGDDMTL